MPNAKQTLSVKAETAKRNVAAEVNLQWVSGKSASNTYFRKINLPRGAIIYNSKRYSFFASVIRALLFSCAEFTVRRQIM